MSIIIPAAIILGLLFISAYFSGGELAVMALDPIALETRARQGSLSAKLQKHLRSRPQRFLSTILIGYNVANILLTAYVTWLAIHYLAPVGNMGEQRATTLSTIAVIVVITIFAELVPKTVAAVDTVRTANLVTYPMYFMDLLMTPLNWLIEKGVMPLTYLLTGKAGRMEVQEVKRADVVTALSLAHAGGELHYADMAVAHEAIRLSTKSLADVMTPRVDVLAAAEECTVGEALTLMMKSGFTRLPVYRDDIDNITGVLTMKDLVRPSLGDLQGEPPASPTWQELPAMPYRREVEYMPATKRAVDTLGQMQRERVHLVVVVDEHGGTAGIVTMEDILEELVGDIQDESDATLAADIVHRTADYTIATGRARLDQLPELADSGIQLGRGTTIGGLVMDRLGRPAAVGDTVAINGVRIVVLRVVRNQIKLLRVEPAETGSHAGS